MAFKIITWPVKILLAVTGIVPFTRCSSGYSDKNGKVTFNGREITDKNFIVLSREFAKDSVNAYYKEKAFQYADVATFEALDDHYAKDQSKVYYCDEYREGQNYYMTKRQTISELKNVRPASFVSIGYGYGKDNVRAYFEGKSFKVYDVAGLKSINRNFVKDNVHAYINCNAIEASDGVTFELTDNNYARDINHIYYYAFDGMTSYNIYKLPVDIKSFKILDYRYSQDKDNVFFLGFTLPGADGGTFTLLSSGYASDKNAVYFRSKKVAGVDPNTFEVYKENDSVGHDVVYARDSFAVYMDDKKLGNADVNTFKVLGENYGIDAAHVFYKTTIVKNAAPASFIVYPHDMGNADAEDSQNKFHEGVKVGD